MAGREDIALDPTLAPVLAVLRVVVAGLLLGGVVAAVVEYRTEPRFPGPIPVELDVTEETVVVPRPGQTFVSGTLTGATVGGAVVAPLGLPVTLPSGKATIEGVSVGGREAVIAWDGGRPLVLEGNGTVDLSPAELTVSIKEMRWRLETATIVGSFRTTAPVAVGRQGLAEPRDGVAFEAPERATIAATGAVTLVHAPRPLEIEGPGAVELRGQLTLRTSEGERPAARLRSEEGPFELRLIPIAGGYRVEGVIQAATVVG